MNGANEEWNKHRKSTTPPEHQGGNVEKRVFGCLVLVLGGLLLGLEKSCEHSGGHGKKSIEYFDTTYQQDGIAENYADPTIPESSPSDIPFDFIAEFASISDENLSYSV